MVKTDVLDMMGELKLYGMKSAYDETLATAIKRKHEPQHFAGDLLKAEISEKQARSIKYQLSTAKVPLAKDVDDFAFKDTPIVAVAQNMRAYIRRRRFHARRSERLFQYVIDDLAVLERPVWRPMRHEQRARGR
jgi:hypothetical protein